MNRKTDEVEQFHNTQGTFVSCIKMDFSEGKKSDDEPLKSEEELIDY